MILMICNIKNMRNKCKEIIAVKDTTYAGEKRKPEEFRLCRDSNQYPHSALTNRVSKPTAGSWSVNWFVIYQGEMKMKR